MKQIGHMYTSTNSSAYIKALLVPDVLLTNFSLNNQNKHQAHDYWNNNNLLKLITLNS